MGTVSTFRLFSELTTLKQLHRCLQNTGNRSKGRTGKEVIRLVEEGRKIIMNQSASENPYTDELFERANKMRMSSQE